MGKKIIKLGGILCLITLVTALLLCGANYITKDIIEKNNEELVTNSMRELVPAEKYEEIAGDVFRGTNGGELAGYCVNTVTKGYGGDIELTVGFDKELAVTGIKITKSSETAGLGANASKPEFSEKLKGKKPELTVSKSGNGGDCELDAISGATITSRAVADGINKAFVLVKEAAK